MAITLNTSPQLVMPVYNPIYTSVTSDKTSQEAFSFIFDIFINGNFINRDRLFQRPGTIEAIYSPARILESYLSYDKSQNTLLSTNSVNAIEQYEIQIGEEYVDQWTFVDNNYYFVAPYVGFTMFNGVGTHNFVSGDTILITQFPGFASNNYNGVFTVLSASTNEIIVDLMHTVSTPVNGGTAVYADRRKTIYSDLASFSGYAFNGVLQYEEVPTWGFQNYNLKTSKVASFLTNQPSVVTVDLTDRGSLSFLRTTAFNASFDYLLEIAVTNKAGVTTIHEVLLPNMKVPQITNNLIQHVGAYPWNVNQMGLGVIIDSSTKSYTLRIVQENPSVSYLGMSEYKTFEINTKCSKFEPVRFMFLNSFGAFDYFTATLLSKESISINKTTYQKVLTYNYDVGDRGRTVLGIEGQQSYTVNSDWINEDTSLWLREMALSAEVYILDNIDGSIIPVIVDMGTYEINKHVNKKLFNQVFTYSKAFTKNTIRG